MSDPRFQTLEALLGWWLEQGGDPGDARSVADWWWLNNSLRGRRLPRRFLPAGGPAEAPVVEADAAEQRATPVEAPDPLPPRPADSDAPDPRAPAVFPPPAREAAPATARLLSPALLPDDDAVREHFRRRQGAVPLLLSQMPLLRRPFPLLMALRPLLQKQPHPRWRVLDEERTAERSAELARPWPAFRPRKVPALAVRLWLDAGLAMGVWWPLAEELRRLLASSQAFARVDLRRLELARLAERGRQNADGATLTLVLSDTAGRHWWDGSMAAWLAGQAREQPLAVLHTLPIRYQERTVLWRRGTPVTLSNSQPLGPNRSYTADAQANLAPRRPRAAEAAPLPAGLKLPVLALDPRALAPWAALVMGDALARTGGTVLPLAGEERGPRPKSEPVDAEALWLAFCQQASPEAQRLMGLMAAAPLLTLPVLRLLLAAEWPELVAPLPLAEVLVSGLVRRCDGDGETRPERMQFAMVPALQAYLEEMLEPRQRVAVIQAITDLLERHWNQQGRGPSFQTLLTDSRTPLPKEAEGLAHFANVTAAMLDRLPGQPFQELARELRAGTSGPPPSPWPAAMVFQEEPFDTARVVWAPPLERIEFETAKVERRDPFFGAVVVTRRKGETRGFRERLAEELSLTMVEIPAGRFTMGSPVGELERVPSEGPQHEVELASFFMSQTPITQAQWREVAQWREGEGERWERELKVAPSWFQGAQGGGEARLLEREVSTDQRPVEQVSWEDAMEFCNRLSQRTGLTYTLPSEAQWEYACRAGTTTPFAFGETLTTELANYNGNYAYANGPKGMYREQTTPVGLSPANAWGLQDMHGNVWEWCLDGWHASYEGAPEDGRAWMERGAGEEKGEKEEEKPSKVSRLLRGGSWVGLPGGCRSAHRDHLSPDNAFDFVGFRVVCLAQGPSLAP